MRSRYVAVIGLPRRTDPWVSGSAALAAGDFGEREFRTAGEERADRPAEGLHRVARAVGVERGLVGVLLVDPHHIGLGLILEERVHERARLALHVRQHRRHPGDDVGALAGLGGDLGDDSGCSWLPTVL